MIAAGTSGIYQSTDGGESWVKKVGGQRAFFVAFHPTDGDKAVGSVLAYDQNWYHKAVYSEDGGEFVPPFKVKTIDAIGCGDAFIAGLLVKLVAGANWRENISNDRLRDSLRFANAVGALTSLNRGVIPALPTSKQVEDFLVNQG